MRASTTFRSLRVRNYRLFFIGQLVSVCGTWTQTIAVGWLVLRLTDDSGVAVGTTIALQYLPTLLLGLWGGLLADRVDKRRLLIVSQAVMAAAAAVLAMVDLTGVVRLWMVYACVTVSGIATSVDQPTRQTFVTEMVGPGELPNAIGLNSAVFNAARMVGPGLAALVIVVSGTGACFLINAASYVAVIAALRMMRPEELHRGKPVARGSGQVREGLRYAWSNPLLRSNLLVMSMIGTLAFNFPVVLPLLAKITFDGNAGTYGLVQSAQGAGALVGALLIASAARTTGRRMLAGCVGLGVAMCVAAVAPSLTLLVVTMPAVGLFMIATASSSNSMIQLDAAPSMRGRVTSVRTLTVLGSTPIGGLITGWVGEQYGPRWAMGLGGVASLLAVALFGRPLLHEAGGQPTPVEDVLETEAAVGAD